MKKIVLYFIISLSLFFVPQLSCAQGGIVGKIVKTISKYTDDALRFTRRTYVIYNIGKNIYGRYSPSNVNTNSIQWSPVYTRSLNIGQSFYKFQASSNLAPYYGSSISADLLKNISKPHYAYKPLNPSAFKPDPSFVREFISINDLRQNLYKMKGECRFEVLKWPNRRIVLPIWP